MGCLDLVVWDAALAAVWQADASTRVTSELVDPRFALFDFLKKGIVCVVVDCWEGVCVNVVVRCQLDVGRIVGSYSSD